MRKYLLSFSSKIILFIVIGITIFVSKISKYRKSRCRKNSNKILVITTFHNVNWFISHITPLSMCGIDELLLVCDDVITEIDNVTYICPSEFLKKIFSRPGAKFFLTIITAIKYRPDLIIGYHIFPNALMALFAGSLINCPACYQLTSGSVQLLGGGWRSENSISSKMIAPSKVIEKMLFVVIKCFDLIVVRGEKTKKFIKDIGYNGNISIITGSVKKIEKNYPFQDRTIDIIFVGRLVEVKRPVTLIEIVKEVHDKYPNVKMKILGDGPLRMDIEALISKKNLTNNIQLLGKKKNVMKFFCNAKIFLLVSEVEGMSIALLEAMTAGVIPVVSDVGELGDIVIANKTGFLVDKDDLRGFAQRCCSILEGDVDVAQLSDNAQVVASKKSSVEAVSGQWRRCMHQVAGQNADL